MEKSHLELRIAVWNKLKKIDFPAAYKVADGANITYKLVHRTGMSSPLAQDNYKKIISEKKETQILYTINSDKVRPKELTKAEIKEFEKFLADIKADERREIVGTDIVAYASPDGPETLTTNFQTREAQVHLRLLKKLPRKTLLAHLLMFLQ